MKKLVIATVGTLAISATAAAAELTYANAFAKRHSIDVSGAGSADLDVFGGAFEFVSNAFTVYGDLARYDLDGVDLTFGSVGVGYTLPGGFTLGADITRADVGASGLGSADADIYSIYGHYAVGDLTFGASVGDSDDLTDTVYSVYASYEVNQSGRVGIDILELENETLTAFYADYELNGYQLSADFISTDGLDLYAIGGEYALSNGFSVIGSISRTDLLGDDATGLQIGGRYEFAPGVSAELSAARLDVDGAGEADIISFGLVYETGRSTSARRTYSSIVNHATSNVVGLSSF